MSNRSFPFLLSVLALAGCLGGEADGPTTPRPDPDPVDPVPGPKRVLPGDYAGEYGYLPDSVRRGFESELILNRDGTYRSLWITDYEAVNDERGAWVQEGDRLILFGSVEHRARNHLFGEPNPLGNDTCALADVGDSAFSRLEVVPVASRRRQWTRFRRVSHPSLADGVYTMNLGDPVQKRYVLTLAGGKYFLAVYDTIESYQMRARCHQVGSFLAFEGIEERERDSAAAWLPWTPADGSMLQRLDAVSDTAFDIWYPGSFFYPAGWDHYHREAP